MIVRNCTIKVNNKTRGRVALKKMLIEELIGLHKIPEQSFRSCLGILLNYKNYSIGR